MQLLRAGVRLAGLLPAQALYRANHAMQEQGIPIDLTQIKPENLEELVDQLNDLTVDVDPERRGDKGESPSVLRVRIKVSAEAATARGEETGTALT